jgi:hypothetical protein
MARALVTKQSEATTCWAADLRSERLGGSPLVAAAWWRVTSLPAEQRSARAWEQAVRGLSCVVGGLGLECRALGRVLQRARGERMPGLLLLLLPLNGHRETKA